MTSAMETTREPTPSQRRGCTTWWCRSATSPMCTTGSVTPLPPSPSAAKSRRSQPRSPRGPRASCACDWRTSTATSTRARAGPCPSSPLSTGPGLSLSRRWSARTARWRCSTRPSMRAPTPSPWRTARARPRCRAGRGKSRWPRGSWSPPPAWRGSTSTASSRRPPRPSAPPGPPRPTSTPRGSPALWWPATMCSCTWRPATSSATRPPSWTGKGSGWRPAAPRRSSLRTWTPRRCPLRTRPRARPSAPSAVR
mmetsp:Transcript_43604/g.139088  ORF Transcript_43604/g.139088 Transcript_43604/m.139088 type:complete len:253 (-) Transcript_43604:254-1012(-)